MQPDRRLGIAVGLDVFVVILFVAIGRRNHEEGSAFSEVLATGAPFLIGLGVAWVVTQAWRKPTAILTGMVIWPVTVLAGMAARRFVFDAGTATAFVIVATLFLGATLLGWRVTYRWFTAKRPISRPTP